MNRRLLKATLLTLLMAWLAPSAFAQLAQIEVLPDQNNWSDMYSNGAAVVEASNGDLVVVIVENGERTNSDFPPEGTPANLVVYRSTDGGTSWSRSSMRTGIETFGLQGIGAPSIALMPSGQLVLIVWYMLDVFPNFDSQIEIHVSDDHGATWSLMDTRGRDIAGLSVTPGGTLVSVDWVDDGIGNLSFWWSTSSNEGDTWTTGALLGDSAGICGVDIDPLSETTWVFTYADCVFGTGGTNRVYAQVTKDAGASWSDPVELTTANSGFGTLGDLVVQEDGSLWLIYSSAFELTYRQGTFEDDEFSFSAPVKWTLGTSVTRDLSPTCAPATEGPLCVFTRNVDGFAAGIYHVGYVGVSLDPLMGDVAAEEGTELPVGLTLTSTYPNPFSGATTIEYDLARAGDVRLSVFNLLGEEVVRLADGVVEAGAHRAVWNANGLPGGVYMVRLSSGGSSVARPATLLR